MNSHKAALVVFAILFIGIFTDNIFAKQASEQYPSKEYEQSLGDKTETERLKETIVQLKVKNKKLIDLVDDKKEKEANDYYFKVWKSYEDVAMHFNDLIIRLRIQSIGGLAALAAILGIFLLINDGKNKKFKYLLAVVALLFLLICWNAIEKLDLQYYDRLLEGSVNAILKLENDKEGFLKDPNIDLSVNIERAFGKPFEHESHKDGRDQFYRNVKFGLIMLIVLSAGLLIYQCKKK